MTRILTKAWFPIDSNSPLTMIASRCLLFNILMGTNGFSTLVSNQPKTASETTETTRLTQTDGEDHGCR